MIERQGKEGKRECEDGAKQGEKVRQENEKKNKFLEVLLGLYVVLISNE